MNIMRCKLFALLFLAAPVYADLVFPDLSYRTGPYAANGAPIADGYADYFTLLNKRDGGIGGAPIRYIACETGYDVARGLECYEATKGEGALLYQPLSTGLTYKLIPKATADGIPIHSMGYGNSATANGKIFPYIFNYPGNYWHAASIIIKYLHSQNNLRDKKITLLYHDSAYGKEPIRILKKLAKKYKYKLHLLSVTHPGTDQNSQWQKIAANRPDYILLWGWGVMNQIAIQKAADINFPMQNLIGTWSASESDVLPAGIRADGYKAISFHAAGDDFPLYADLRKYVIAPGLGSGDASHLGSVLYNRGLYAAILAAEAVRNAQKIHAIKQINSRQMRDGMESLNLNKSRMQELGIPNFGAPLSISCANHAGPGSAAVHQWNAQTKKWQRLSDFIPAERKIVDRLINTAAKKYAKQNAITPRKCHG